MLDQAGHKISKASRHLQANPEFNNKYEFIVRFTNCQKLFDTIEHTIFYEWYGQINIINYYNLLIIGSFSFYLNLGLSILESSYTAH